MGLSRLTFSLALLAAVITAIYATIHISKPKGHASAYALTGSGLVTSPWPKLFHDVANTSLAGNGGSNGTSRWTYSVGDTKSSSAIGSDGTIYQAAPGTLYALNTDGTLKWSLAETGIASTPAVALGFGSEGEVVRRPAKGQTKLARVTDTVIYITFGSVLYQVGSGGSVNWSYTLGGTPTIASPTVDSSGNVIVRSETVLYSINSSGTLNWSYGIESSGTGSPMDSSPALDTSGNVYVGTSMSSNNEVFSLNASTGSLNWTYTASPGLGTILGVSVGPDGNVFATCADGRLVSINPSTGAANWTYSVASSGSYGISDPAAIGSDGTLYFASWTGTEPRVDSVTAVNASDGSQKWLGSGNSDTFGISAPAVGSDGTIYLGSTSGKVYAVEPTAGSTIWSETVGSDFEASPAIGSDGGIYLADNSAGDLYVLGTSEVLTGLTLSPTSVVGGNASTGTVTLSGFAPLGGLTVSLSSSNTSAATVPTSVAVSAGSATESFTVTTFAATSAATSTITATLGSSNATATLTVNIATISGLTLSPTSVYGGQTSTGTVTLTGPAPSAGWSVSLTSSDPCATVPASVTVLSGSTTATFTVNTTGGNSNATSTITATLNSTSGTATLTVRPPRVTNLSLSSSLVYGGTNITATITLSGPAPSGGTAVTMGSSDGGVATFGGYTSDVVTIPSGLSSYPVTVNTIPQGGSSNKTSIIDAHQLGVTDPTCTLYVEPVRLSSISLSPVDVVGGTSTTCTVTLSGPAPTSGAIVAISSANSTLVPVPSSVTVPSENATASFTITPGTVTSYTEVVITGNLNATQTCGIIVTYPTVTGLSLSPTSVIGGTSSTGTVTISGPAPTGGWTVSLSSSVTSAATVPSSVSVSAGYTTASFTVSTSAVGTTQTPTVTATSGTSSATATLTVGIATISGLTLSPTGLSAGLPSTGTVNLTGPAPSGGLTVSLSSSNPSIATVPSTVTVSSGASSATFTVTTLAPGTSVITATLGSSSANATQSVWDPKIATFILSSGQVFGGATVTANLSLTAPAPSGGITIYFTTGDSGIATVSPASHLIPEGVQSITTICTVTTIPFAGTNGTKESVLITAMQPGVTAPGDTLKVESTYLNDLSLSPTTVAGGNSSTCTVELSGAAPTGGADVTLSSSNTSLATVPTDVTVPAGAYTATFTVTTSAVTSETPVTISGTYEGTATTYITLTPALLAMSAASPLWMDGVLECLIPSKANVPRGSFFDDDRGDPRLLRERRNLGGRIRRV